jgi:20S proteasome alpha/beta subunit
MTILVGIRCKDGIVIGTDSAATFTAGPQLRTIEQPGVKKISIIADRIIVAGTGEIGLGQRFCQVVQTAHDQHKLFQKESVEVGRQLAASAVNDFASTKADRGSYGALVAFPTGSSFELCEFATSNFQPELKRDIWYVSMGSGQPIADPCLGFIRQAFWADGVPSSEDGVFAVVWTLAQAIKLNPGGINAPMQVATLNTRSGKAHARLLDEAEILEHEENVNGAIEHLRQYRGKIQGGDAVDLPKAPAAAPAPAATAGAVEAGGARRPAPASR